MTSPLDAFSPADAAAPVAAGRDENRTMLLWCPDWPVVAAETVDGVPATRPVVVLRANRVVACSESARAEGVRRGLRRREAQSRSPGLIVVEHDPGRDARAFEPVVAAVEEVAVGVEVVRPGACAFAARGPARYFGGEEAAAERIVEQVAQVCAVESQLGIADGVFAAGLAARDGRIVAPGGTREFLARVGVEALDRPELVDLLRRLGLRTLGDFAALPPGDVLTRFGFDGALAYRLAAGADHRPLAVRRPPPDLEVTETYDDPLERVDVAAFAGRILAERLHDRLAAHGLGCTRLGIEAVTADGQELHRLWRHDGMLAAAAIAERVRWQLDGWLSGTHRTDRAARPTAGVVRLRLIPDGVIVHLGLQPGLWGDAGAERDRAHRALSRVQGLLGPEAVVTPILGGGRSAADQVRFIPWGDERTPARPGPPAAPPGPGPDTGPAADPGSIAGPDIGPSLSAGRSPSADSSSRVGRGIGSGPGGEPGRGTRSASSGGPKAGSGLNSDSGLGLIAVPGSGAGSHGGPGRSAGPRIGLVAAADLTAVPRIDPLSGPGSNAARGLKAVLSTGPEDPDAGPNAGRHPDARTPGTTPDSGQTVMATGSNAGGKVVARRAKGTLAKRVRDPTAGLPPWPGRLPEPAPALVLPLPLAAVVQDSDGAIVQVSARLEVTGEPAVLLVERAPPVVITGWVGPWPVDERWWAPAEGRRRARFQAGLADGRAVLLFLAAGHWAVEAIYD